MKIFISWSGPRSCAVAEALNDWLRRVIQAVRPFYSPEIEKGAKWSSELDAALEGTKFGIICLTPENINSTWIHYEAGALSKTKDALIWTFLHGLTPGDVPQPLGRFQHTVAEREDVLRLLRSINSRIADVGGEPLPERLLEENFDLYWPRLEEHLAVVSSDSEQARTTENPEATEAQRDDRAVLDEILELMRNQERRLVQLEERATPTRRGRSIGTITDEVYRRLEIRMPTERTDANALALEVADSLERNYEGATVKVLEIGGWPLVSVTFDPALQLADIKLLLSALDDELGYGFEHWRAFV